MLACGRATIRYQALTRSDSAIESGIRPAVAAKHNGDLKSELTGSSKTLAVHDEHVNTVALHVCLLMLQWADSEISSRFYLIYS